MAILRDRQTIERSFGPCRDSYERHAEHATAATGIPTFRVPAFRRGVIQRFPIESHDFRSHQMQPVQECVDENVLTSHDDRPEHVRARPITTYPPGPTRRESRQAGKPGPLFAPAPKAVLEQSVSTF